MAILVKNCKFSPSCVFNAPLREFCLECCNGGSTQTLRFMPYQKVERVMCVRLDTIPECDGQTDRFAKTISRSAWMACWRAIKIKLWIPSSALYLVNLLLSLFSFFLFNRPIFPENTSTSSLGRVLTQRRIFGDCKCEIFYKFGALPVTQPTAWKNWKIPSSV